MKARYADFGFGLVAGICLTIGGGILTIGGKAESAPVRVRSIEANQIESTKQILSAIGRLRVEVESLKNEVRLKPILPEVRR